MVLHANMAHNATFIPYNQKIRMEGGVIFIISLSGDAVLSYLGYHEIQRLSCFRYLFLSVIAYMYIHNFHIKRYWFFILMSAGYLAYITYFDIPNWLDKLLPEGWEQQTSLSYFYTLFLFIVLTKLYEAMKTAKVSKLIKFCGENSWELFVSQMIVLGTFYPFISNFKLISPEISNFTTFLIVFSLSITYVWCYKATIKKYIIPRLYIQKN